MIRQIRVGPGTPDEVEEWSLFMGRPVDPIEVFELKIRFAALLRMEGWDPERQKRRGAVYESIGSP